MLCLSEPSELGKKFKSLSCFCSLSFFFFLKEAEGDLNWFELVGPNLTNHYMIKTNILSDLTCTAMGLFKEACM